MAHTLQERYSKLVDIKLRDTLVKKDGVIFNTRYEGDPKAGAVKIPVRDTEVQVSDYVKATGADLTQGSTTYITATIDKDKVINEVIDGYDAAAVPDNLVADRIDSGSYSLALKIDNDATEVMEAAATQYSDTTPLTEKTVYAAFVGMRTELSKAKVPNDNKRFALVSPDVMALILNSDKFTHASQMGDEVIKTGVQARCAGFNIYEDNTLGSNTEIIAGHPNWCCRVREWSVPVHIQDINGSGKFIGASAVQGRTIYTHKITKPETLLIKKKA